VKDNEYLEVISEPTKADEVEHLIEIAVDCGFEKDKGLFIEILDRIYPCAKNEATDLMNSIVGIYSKFVDSIAGKCDEDDDLEDNQQ